MTFVAIPENLPFWKQIVLAMASGVGFGVGFSLVASLIVVVGMLMQAKP